jgi:GT2 family glycosyltransferase
VPVSKRPTDYERNTAGLQSADFITANCCCTKKALLLTGGFDQQFTMAWREDSDLEFKLLEAKIPIRKVKEAIVVHPVRKASWGVSIKEQKKTAFNALLYKKYPTLYRQKIQSRPPFHYYGIIAAFCLMIAGLIFRQNETFVAGILSWLLLSLWFIFQRIRGTSLAPAHLLEMAITSFCIPFISIYWQCYGAVKYRVFFL